MELYDFLMLGVLVASTLLGAWKGMAWQLAAFASVLVSAVVAAHYYGLLVGYIDLQPPWDRCVAMAVVYLVVALAIWLLYRLVAGIIDRVRLKEFDRQIGALLGAAKGVVWCVAITYFAVTLCESKREQILGTRSGYYATVLMHRASLMLPTEIRVTLGHYIEQFKETLDRKPPAGQPLAAEVPVANSPVSTTILST